MFPARGGDVGGDVFSKNELDPYREFLEKHKPIAEFVTAVNEETVRYSALVDREGFLEQLEELARTDIGEAAQPSRLSRILRRDRGLLLDRLSARRMGLIRRAVEVALDKSPWEHQIVCATLLLQGRIVELPNGAGKSIAAAMAASFHATWKQCAHIVTVNDYLAERDVREMGPLYQLLDLDVGIIYSKQTEELRWGMLEPDGRTLRVRPEEGSALFESAHAARLAEEGTKLEQQLEPPLLEEAAPPGEEPNDGAEIPVPEPLAPAPVDPVGAEEQETAIVSQSEELAHRPLADILPDLNLPEKRVFECDVLYGQIGDLGLTYLRDFHKYDPAEQVLTRPDLLIVDECDSVLLDDLRQPLISSTHGSVATGLPPDTLAQLRVLAERLTNDVDIVVSGQNVRLTFEGVKTVQDLTGADFFRPDKAGLALGLRNALQAIHTYHERERYIVRQGSVVIINQESGRLTPDRRFGDGLHEAIEVKEGLPVDPNRHRLHETAKITINNFVQVYSTVAGMSGAVGPPAEYERFYGLECEILIPEPPTRIDHPDIVFRTKEETLRATAFEALLQAAAGRAVLVNVPTIRAVDEVSRELARLRDEVSVEDLVGLAYARDLVDDPTFRSLVARRAEPGFARFQALDGRTTTDLGQEAERVRVAGQAGFVTICSKIAARGTDIKLSDEARNNGGLYVVGLERGLDRRYDNQLRGRAARHGEPGDSVFIVSLQDPLMVVFGGERMQSLMLRLGMEPDVPIESSMITRRIEVAQTKMQRANQRFRRAVVEFDDVRARHRVVLHRIRQRILVHEDPAVELQIMADNWVEYNGRSILKARPGAYAGSADGRHSLGRLSRYFEPIEADRIFQGRTWRTQVETLRATLRAKVEAAATLIPHGTLRYVILHALDGHWTAYLRFENSARDQIMLHGFDDPEGFGEYARAMEERFDAFFYEVGEEALGNVFGRARSFHRSERALGASAGRTL